MALLTDNLATRIGTVILGSFAVIAVLVAVLLLWPSPRHTGQGLFDLPVPAETIAIVRALEASPPAARPLVLEALNNSVTAVHIEPSFPPVAPNLHRAPQLEWIFSRYSQLLDGRPFRVDQRSGLLLHLFRSDRPLHPDASVRMLVALRGGGVLVIEHRPPAFLRGYLARAAAVAGAAALVLLAGLAVAVRQAARPVARLAHAARRFSIDQAAPDLPVTGPRELRELSSAFNDMQSRIRDLVQDRTRVLAAIAHDLRTYLTRLRLRAEFIADDDQRVRAERDIEEMALLLDDTLTFARQSAGVTPDGARCDAVAVVRELVDQRRELGQPVRLIDGSPASTPEAAYSRLSLQRMLGNLVDNAIRYGGQADLYVKATDDAVAIEVRDRGPGIPSEALARVTEPFERLEVSRARGTGGAGLGLAIVKALAQSAGGALLLENVDGGGLSATLHLPIRL